MTKVPAETQPGTTVQDARTCGKTGLEIVRAAGLLTWRVAESKFGPLNPRPAAPTRPNSNQDSWKSWNRWDVPGRRTVYTATSAKVSFAEVLSFHKQKLADGLGRLDLSKYIDDIDTADQGLEVMREEWPNSHMAPGSLPASWREARLLYPVWVPQDGWYVRITSMQSMAAMAQHLGSQLTLLGGIDEVDLSLLASDRRDVTCLIADWVHGLVLDDGALPHGILYPSRHDGTETCYATWLRRTDDGLDPVTEPIRAGSGHPIDVHNPDLRHVQRLFGIRGF